MSVFGKCKTLIIGAMLQGMLNTAVAGDVSILMADFRSVGSSQWAVNVTLKHEDEGWDHYADNWRVVDAQGTVLGDRVLFHPHVDEQPFTRGINSVLIPVGVTNVYIEAHDKKHGWTTERLQVDLTKVKSGHVRVYAAGEGEQVQSWRMKNLGDAMLAGDDLESIQGLFQHVYEKAGSPANMAIYVRHEAEGRLHCEVKLYFTPASSELAEAVGARCCSQPSFEGLGLLLGSETALSII